MQPPHPRSQRAGEAVWETSRLLGILSLSAPLSLIRAPTQQSKQRRQGKHTPSPARGQKQAGRARCSGEAGTPGSARWSSGSGGLPRCKNTPWILAPPEHLTCVRSKRPPPHRSFCLQWHPGSARRLLGKPCLRIMPFFSERAPIGAEASARDVGGRPASRSEFPQTSQICGAHSNYPSLSVIILGLGEMSGLEQDGAQS